MCHGSGNRAKWVGLRELSDLLERATTFEPDYLELAQEQPVSQYHDSRVQPAPETNRQSIYLSAFPI